MYNQLFFLNKINLYTVYLHNKSDTGTIYFLNSVFLIFRRLPQEIEIDDLSFERDATKLGGIAFRSPLRESVTKIILLLTTIQI